MTNVLASLLPLCRVVTIEPKVGSVNLVVEPPNVKGVEALCEDNSIPCKLECAGGLFYYATLRLSEVM